MFNFKLFFPLSTLLLLSPCLAQSDRTIGDVIKQAKRREKVLIGGHITQAFDFDTFLVSDGTGEIAVSFVGLKHNVSQDDDVVIYGWFEGRTSFLTKYGFLHAIAWSPAQNADQLRAKFGAPKGFQSIAETAEVSPPAPHNIESRLRVLDDLKAKGLISSDEYNEQRKRILNDL